LGAAAGGKELKQGYCAGRDGTPVFMQSDQHRIHAYFCDPGYPDQVYLSDPRTCAIGTHFEW